jgi:hypothetical protein
MWSRQLGDIRFPVATTPSMIAVGMSDPHRLVILDRPTGQVLRQVELQSKLTTSAALSGPFVLLGSESGVEMRRLVDGEVVWGPLSECGTAATPLAVDDTRCFFVNEESVLVVVRLRDGRVLARVPGVNPNTPPLLATNGIIVQGEAGLMFAEHEHWAASLTGWCADAGVRLTSPAVHHRGSLYCAVEGAGLACFGGDAP